MKDINANAAKPALEDATDERLAKAANDNFKGADGVRRFVDDPLQRLANRGALYPDREINRKLYQAGVQYCTDWYLSNMSPLAAFDPTRVFTGGGEGGCGMPVSATQAERRDSYRKAAAYLGKKYRQVVDLVVLEQQADFVAIGRKASGLAGEKACRAIAIERLTAGLFLLAKHYAIVK